jgi:hypothetical protein
LNRFKVGLAVEGLGKRFSGRVCPDVLSDTCKPFSPSESPPGRLTGYRLALEPWRLPYVLVTVSARHGGESRLCDAFCQFHIPGFVSFLLGYIDSVGKSRDVTDPDIKQISDPEAGVDADLPEQIVRRHQGRFEPLSI